LRQGKKKKKGTAPYFSRLATEQLNPAAKHLDLKSALEIARIINKEDAKVAGAVKRVLPQIARAIDLIADALRQNGRLIYVGAGTSGRLAALDAAELPPTFNLDRRMIQIVIAGGRRALSSAVESEEDSPRSGEKAIGKLRPTNKDVVIGISASGRTPFTVAALKYARRRHAATIAITCNRASPIEKAADLAIVAQVGPEIISGSSRMKAGTAQKMILNMLSTGAMTRLGYVYDGLMVNVVPNNAKLTERAIGIVQQTARVDRSHAKDALAQSGNSVPVALVMTIAGVKRADAVRALTKHKDNLRRAMGALKANS
jgi:N-acetylmuramic acid 6-phosphate etherase